MNTETKRSKARSESSAEPVDRRFGGPWLTRCAIALIVVGAALFPMITGNAYYMFVLATIGVYLLVAMGLNLVMGYGGQPSLGHGGLLAVGAYTASIMMVDHAWSFWVAMPLAALVAAIFAALMATVALRLSNWYLAIITLGFAIVVEGLLVELDWLTHGWAGITGVPAPEFFGIVFGDAEFLWLVLIANCFAALLVANIVRSRMGRGLIATRESAEVAHANGVRTGAVKAYSFIFSGVLAGVAGALFAVQKIVITPDDFHAEFSIFFLVVVVLGGAGRLWGPILGTFAFFAMPELLTGLADWRQLVYGVILLLLVIFVPKGLTGVFDAVFARLRGTGRRADFATDSDTHPAAPDATQVVVEFEASTVAQDLARPINSMRPTLTVQDVTKEFGGLRALDNVSLRAYAGQVHAIVGPNGSGKTTMLNLISGFYKIDKGTIDLEGESINGVSSPKLVGKGIARTFQTPRLLPDLTVRENLMLGAYTRERANPLQIVARTSAFRQERARLRREAAELLDFVGLGHTADRSPGDIPHGHQRLIEIARGLMSRPKVLLLDEPAAGLSLDELDRLGELVRSIRDAGIAVVIVEHHIELIFDIADRVSVFDQGRVLADGKASEVFGLESVRSAYMGSAAR